MSRGIRLLKIGGIALLALALPAIGVARDPAVSVLGPASGPQGQSVSLASLPAIVPGASVLAVGFGDEGAFAVTGESSIVYQNVGGVLSTYATSGFITAAPKLPAGATIWQIDAYGYAFPGPFGPPAEFHTVDMSTGSVSFDFIPPASGGPGVVQSTLTFPTGATLAPGEAWYLVVGADSSSAFIGAVFQYTLPTLSYVPITPARVIDTRLGFGGIFSPGVPRTIDVKDAHDLVTGSVTVPNAIPAGARAVTFNLTITSTVNGGYAVVIPGASSTVTSSNINWTASGVTLANGGVVGLGTGSAERQVTIVTGGTSSSRVHVILDVTGYYQ